MKQMSRIGLLAAMASVVSLVAVLFTSTWGVSVIRQRNFPEPRHQLALWSGLGALIDRAARADRELSDLLIVRNSNIELRSESAIGRIKQLQEECAKLRARMRSQFKLVDPRVKGASGRLVDKVYSISYYKRVILDPQSDPKHRAKAFDSITLLPEPNLHLTSDMVDVWRNDLFMAPNREVEITLLAALARIETPPSVKSVYFDRLVSSPDEEVRRFAIDALKEFPGDPVVHGAVMLIADSDPSSMVRDRAREAIRRYFPRD